VRQCLVVLLPSGDRTAFTSAPRTRGTGVREHTKQGLGARRILMTIAYGERTP